MPEKYILTTEHSASSYGQPVLVDTETGQAYGTGDILPDGNKTSNIDRGRARVSARPRIQKAGEI
jgi:hypothetical protein